MASESRVGGDGEDSLASNCSSKAATNSDTKSPEGMMEARSHWARTEYGDDDNDVDRF